MEEKDNPKEMAKAKLVGEFYYTLALLQTKAITYVAHGENEEDKLARVKETIMLIEKTGAEISSEDLAAPEDCQIPPCHIDQVLNMCMCPLGD